MSYFLTEQLLLLKRGGQAIYAGPLGQNSEKMIEYFEVRILNPQFPCI